MINSTLLSCPTNVQANVGEIHYYPVSFGTLMGISGCTDKKTGEIWLTLWSGKHTLLHEIGHSVYFRTEHKDFTTQFKQSKGFVSVWSWNTNEEIAEAFVEGMKNRHNQKIDLARRFYNK